MPGNVNIAIAGDNLPIKVNKPIGKHANWNNNAGNQATITKDRILVSISSPNNLDARVMFSSLNKRLEGLGATNV